MKRLTATLTIATACVLAAPAQAVTSHCGACATGWRYFDASQLSVPASGSVSNAMIREAVENSLNRYNSNEYLIAAATLSQSRSSSTSGWAMTFADYGWRYTPPRITWLPTQRYHQCQADWDSASWYDVRVRCPTHGDRAH